MPIVMHLLARRRDGAIAAIIYCPYFLVDDEAGQAPESPWRVWLHKPSWRSISAYSVLWRQGDAGAFRFPRIIQFSISFQSARLQRHLFELFAAIALARVWIMVFELLMLDEISSYLYFIFMISIISKMSHSGIYFHIDIDVSLLCSPVASGHCRSMPGVITPLPADSCN